MQCTSFPRSCNNLATNQSQNSLCMAHTADIGKISENCGANQRQRWNRIESTDSACGAVLYMYVLIAGATVDYTLYVERMKYGGSFKWSYTPS